MLVDNRSDRIPIKHAKGYIWTFQLVILFILVAGAGFLFWKYGIQEPQAPPIQEEADD